MELLNRFKKKNNTLLTKNIAPKSTSAIILYGFSCLIWIGAVVMVGATMTSFHTKTVSEDPIKSELTRLFSDKKIVSEDSSENTFLENILPKSNVQEDYLDVPEKNLFAERRGDPGFPPGGDKLLSLRGYVFFENQRKYEPVRLELVQWGNAIYLAGAGMCEVVQSKYVLLKPCIFRDKIVDDLSIGSATPYEIEMIQSINFFLTLPFEPYARHITSSLSCYGSNKYKLTVQYLNSAKEGYISVNIPFSSSEVDALGDLKKEESNKCSGLDIFFEPESILLMNSAIEEARNKNNKFKGN